MQDRYSGDVGDFGKFSLIRALLPKDKFKLGVIWYLYPDESHNNDGRHIEYLNKDEYLRCDRELRNKLKTITTNKRFVSELESCGILPNNTTFFSEKLDFHLANMTQTQHDKNTRLKKREQWLENAVDETANCNALFLDPDNGLEIKSCSKTSMIKAGKFAYYNEVKELFKNKDICVIYHHMNMNNPHEEQIKARAHELREKISPSGKIFAARFKPYSPRAYFILTSQSKENQIEQSFKDFLESPCGCHWDTYYQA